MNVVASINSEFIHIDCDSNPWFDIHGIGEILYIDGFTLRELTVNYISHHSIISLDNVDWLSETGAYEISTLLLTTGRLAESERLRHWLSVHVPLVHEQTKRNIWAEYSAVATIELEELQHNGGYVFIAKSEEFAGMYLMDSAYNVQWRIRQLSDKGRWQPVLKFKCTKRQETLVKLKNYFINKHVADNIYYFKDDEEAIHLSLLYEKLHAKK